MKYLNPKYLNSGIITQMLDPLNYVDQVKRTLSLLPLERMPGISSAVSAVVFVCGGMTYI